MARDSNGNYARIHNWVTDLGNSIPITASRVDAEMDSEATALTNSLDRSTSGGGDILRDVGMSNHKFTAMSSGSALLDSINYDDVQSGKISFFGTTAGTSTVYTLAPSPSINALDTGMPFWFKVDEDCGASPTINISAKGAVNLLKDNKITGAQVNLTALDLQTGVFYLGVYNGTGVVVQNPAKIESVSIEKVLNIQQEAQTIASGVVPFLYSNIVLLAQSGTADDFDGFTGGVAGNIVAIRADSGDTLTLKHTTTFFLTPRQDCRLISGDIIFMICIAPGSFVQISRSTIDDFRSGSGYYYLPNNRLVQFGIYSSSAHGPTVTFGIAFDSVDVVTGNTITTGASFLSIDSLSTTNFVASQYNNEGGALTNDFYWQAIGTKAQ